jgi:hypothetical protein
MSSKISIYSKYPPIPETGEICAVLNVDGSKFKAAVLDGNTGKVIKWLGRKCVRDESPEREAGNYYSNSWEEK